MYQITLHMLLPVPTAAVLYETRVEHVARQEYNRALRRLGPALSASTTPAGPMAVLAEDRTLTMTYQLTGL